MVFCKECGVKNPDHAVYCQGCGNKIKIYPNNKSNTKIESKKLDSMWIVAAILVPIVGLISGIYYYSKGRKGADTVILVSIAVWAIGAILISLTRL